MLNYVIYDYGNPFISLYRVDKKNEYNYRRLYIYIGLAYLMTMTVRE